jgi:branched-chain amino acid transport system permease protein
MPLIGSTSTWVTLTVAGLAMGMIIFIIASGLTLVFGLMDVLNFGHGVFIALGAFVATTVLGVMGDWTGSDRTVAQSGGGVPGHAGSHGWWQVR